MYIGVEFDDTESLYDHYKVPLPQPSSMDYGAYLREMRQRQQLQMQQQQLGGDRVPSRLSQREEYCGGGIIVVVFALSFIMETHSCSIHDGPYTKSWS